MVDRRHAGSGLIHRIGGAPYLPLDVQIKGILGASLQGLYLANQGLTVSDAVDQWDDLSGNARHLTSTLTARPTYSATGLNSRPGVVFDGSNDIMSSSNVSWTGIVWTSITVLFLDGDTAARTVCCIGSGTVGQRVRVNQSAAGDVASINRVGASQNNAVSAATIYPMTTPTTVTATWDGTLATNEAEIYVAGTNVTNARPANVNLSGDFGSLPIRIGSDSATFLNGTVAGMLVCGGTDTLAANITNILAASALLRAEWGL